MGGGEESLIHTVYAFPKSWKNSKLLHTLVTQSRLIVVAARWRSVKVQNFLIYLMLFFLRTSIRLRTPEFTLKDEHKKAILAVYEGKDVFVSLPTSFGKSIYFSDTPFCV